MGCSHRESSDAETLFLLWHLFWLWHYSYNHSSWYINVDSSTEEELLYKQMMVKFCLFAGVFFVISFSILLLSCFFFLFSNIIFLSVMWPTNTVCNLYCCYPQHNIFLPFPLHDLGKYCHLYLNGKIWNWRSRYFFSSQALNG